MLKEFKKFIMRGNVIDLAVGVIIGSAFNKIVTSIVNDMITPILSLLTGKINFNSLFIALDGRHYDTLEEAGSVATIKVGSFLTSVIDFLIMSMVVFLLVKGINMIYEKTKKDEPKPAEPVKRLCPYCFGEINEKATKCPHCTSDVGDKQL